MKKQLSVETTSKNGDGDGWKSLDTQVGGHTFSHGKYGQQKLGIIDLENGFILKSLQNPPRGQRELNFYEKVFDLQSKDTDLIEGRQFLSQYAGTEERNGAKFIKLKNLTADFTEPCIADLKMGRITYDQEASEEKKAHEIAKYPPLWNLGFQFTGMSIYNPTTQSRQKFEKAFCRGLTENTIVNDGLGQFFGLPNLRKDAIQVVLSKLKRMESWFLRQKRFSFTASSLLIVYEGLLASRTQLNTDVSKKASTGTEQKTRELAKRSSEDDDDSCGNDSKRLKKHQENKQQNSFEEQSCQSVIEKQTAISSVLPLVADVHLIDFAHAFPATDIDHSFLFGLQKLISFLHELLDQRP